MTCLDHVPLSLSLFYTCVLIVFCSVFDGANCRVIQRDLYRSVHYILISFWCQSPSFLGISSLFGLDLAIHAYTSVISHPVTLLVCSGLILLIGLQAFPAYICCTLSSTQACVDSFPPLVCTNYSFSFFCLLLFSASTKAKLQRFGVTCYNIFGGILIFLH